MVSGAERTFFEVWRRPSGTWSFIVSIIFCVVFSQLGIAVALARSERVRANEYGESGDAPGTYFHLYAEYLVGDTETLAFDIQVSCGTHVFENERVVRGYLPALYARRTASGAAVMLATPRVCDAIRMAEKREVEGAQELQAAWRRVLEGNFIPFTIWFENAEDLTFGLGFPLAESFDNPASPLKFVDARVEPSTARAFTTWFQADSGNLLQERQIGPRYVTEKEDQAYWSTFDPDKPLLPTKCFGLAVLPHDKRSLSATSPYYPDYRPRYWFAPADLPDTGGSGKRNKRLLAPNTHIGYYGRQTAEFPIGFNYLRRTRIDNKGSYSESPWKIAAPEVYPVIQSDGFPFAKKGAFEDRHLKLTVEITTEKKGLLACYSKFNPIGYGEENFEDFFEYFFGSNYKMRVKDFGKLIDLEINDDDGPVLFQSIPAPSTLPHFLISDQGVAEFVTFEFFGGGHVR